MDQLTRRALLGRAAAGGGALIAPAAARALTEPRDAVFAMALPPRPRGPLAAPAPFDLVAVEWESPAGARIELRTRRAGGRWSRWIAAPYAHGHEAESGGARRLLTDPVWTGPADGFELRSSRELRGAQAHFVRTGSAGSA
ncbi:MAG: hypothetical protein ACJ76Z_16030, partial [Thermoleophilaceae bacterium]